MTAAFGLADIPPGPYRRAAIAAYAASVSGSVGPRAEPDTDAPDRPTAGKAQAKSTAHGRRPARSGLVARSDRAGTRYRCTTCDAGHDTYAAAERHADTHGGARIEWSDR
jgi:hypothetical protein